MQKESQYSLLYRYFFFSWLFRDVHQGSWLERSAAWRYNKAHAHWLLTYLKRWAVVNCSAFAAGCFTSLLFQGHWICVPFFMLFSLAMSVLTVILAAWLGLRLMPDP